MTVLLVDDQQSILNGLLSGVPFAEVGFDTVLTAGNALEAFDIIQSRPVDVLLTDIEMPGENGLQLIEKVRAAHPGILCVPLTSHADFEFAKQSVRLGCFDYLVQPAPYQDIAACLKKAFDRRVELAREAYDRQLGSMVRVNEPGVTGSMVVKLFSLIPEEVAEAMHYLTASGYVIQRDTPVRPCAVIDLPYLRREDPSLTQDGLMTAIRESFTLAPGHPVTLICRNPYRQFMILLCHPDGVSAPPCTRETFDAALRELTRRLQREPALYVLPETTLDRINGMIASVQKLTEENVTERTGVIDSSAPAGTPAFASPVADQLPRWKALLEQNKYDILLHEMQAFLERFRQLHPSLHMLSDLHQQWTQMFFEHLSSRGVSILSLFTGEYTYAMYLECFRTVHRLEKGILFVLDAAAARMDIALEQDDVELAKAYIHSHLNQPILVTDVADQVNLSSEYFSRQFKKETGLSIKDYIIQAKVDAAKDLLARSDIPVSLIALEMGYDNFSHFTQIFKKICGVTPSDYRKDCRERG